VEARKPTNGSSTWHRVRQLLTLGVVAAFLGLLAYGVISKAPNRAIDDSLAKEHAPPAPEVKLPVLARGELGPRLDSRLAPALADGQVTLAELRGTPVVLNFWASWCIPCRVEAPILETAWEQQRPRGLLILGLNMQDLSTDANNFISRYHNTYLNIRDEGGDTAHRWGVTGIPETFFISAAGRVVDHVIGAVSSDQLSAGIAAARSGRPIGAQSGGASRPTR
jgi:cytochrome c biogenesis protein CcmG, thiol:disulfide interchange protein DsbE